MNLCFCFYNENIPCNGCGIESQFLKNCGKQLDVYLFKYFGGRDEVAMGTESYFPQNDSICPHFAPGAQLGSPLWDRVCYYLGKQLHIHITIPSFP